MVKANPPSRRRPQYIESVHGVFIPSEAKASSEILGAILLHEAVHARDTSNPNYATARGDDPAAQLLSEIAAFTLEVTMLERLFGQEFANYTQSEVDATDQAAIANQEKYGGLMFEAGVTPSLVKEALTRNLCFLDKAAENFAMGMLGVALPIGIALRAIDQICKRNNAPDDILQEMKLSCMSDYYDPY